SVCTHLARDGEEGVWKIDHDARDGDLGCDVILIRVRSDDERLLRLACCAEHAEPRGIGILKDHVGVAADLGECLLASRAHVVPVADVRRQYRDLWIHHASTAAERGEVLAYRWKPSA